MRKPRGFTLLEIMIALVVSAIALVAAIAAANAQQRAFYNGQKGRAAQNAGRGALLFLEQKLPLAGFGMDAPLALDFGWYVPATGAIDHDRTDASDELVFYARDPAYWVPADVAGAPLGRAWNVTELTDTTVSVTSRPDDVFRKGQVLQLVCPGVLRYAYFTVAATTPPSPGGSFAVRLEPVVEGNPFRRQDALAGHACLTTGARLFLVDRYRFYVRTVDVGGRTEPYLVLDMGVDRDENGTIEDADELLVAEGIESFQVSYVFTSPAFAAAGETPGTAITLATGAAGTAANTVTRTTFPGTLEPGQSLYEPSSFYRHRLLTPLPPERLTNHQANIRTVGIALVARSPEPDPSSSANLVWGAGSSLLRLNQSATPAWVPADGGYQRAVLETSVTLPNMTVRALSYF
jgi:type IV pilus assembly protein PilW